MAKSDAPQQRFRSHSNYVEALAMVGRGGRLLQTNKKALDSLAGASIPSDAIPASIDEDQVARCLRNAWSTELLLALPPHLTDSDDFVRLANSWGVIQAYYVGYHFTQALVVAKGGTRPSTHPKTQALYADLWVDRPLDIAPWTLGVGDAGPVNVPPGISIDLSVHPWSGCSPGTCWSLAAKVIKTTRDDVVGDRVARRRDEKRKERRRAWQAEEDARLANGRAPRKDPGDALPRLTKAEKIQCGQRLRTFTLLDYQWRLRVNSNYDDAAVFIDGPEDDVRSGLVQRNMAYLAAGLGLITELRIGQLVGAKSIADWADDFIASAVPGGVSVGVKARRHLLP